MKFDTTSVIIISTFVVLCISSVSSQNNNNFDDNFNYAREVSRPGEFNERCRSVKDCRKFGYVCRDNTTCQCDNNYIPNFQRTACVGGVNQRCSYDEHCIEGAYCMNQAVCKCKESSPVIFEYGLVCSKAASYSKAVITMIYLFLVFLLG